MNARRVLIALPVLSAVVAAAIFLAAQFVTVAPRRLNVLLISVDTLRADRLGCYGCATARTPNIDALARAGVVFEQCMTAAPITLPAHASILTGAYPFVHGVRDNGFFCLHPDNVTLAERLREGGYATGAVVAAFVMNREFGLDQGFESYNDMHTAAPAGGDKGEFSERTAEQVTNAALEWLGAQGRGGAARERSPGKPWFLFVHYFDPHYPHEAPARFAGAAGDGYAAEIAYVDEQIGRLLAALSERKMERETLVVLTADHGEGLGQHGEDSHAGFVYDATLSVPLIVKCPDGRGAGARVTAQARTVDIMPTILDLGHAPASGQGPSRGSAPAGGQEPADGPAPSGESLAAFLGGATADQDRVAYAETMYPRFNYGYAALRALRAGGWKYIHAPTPELYDLRKDPNELINVAGSEPQRVQAFQGQLRGLIADAAIVASERQARRSASPADVRALQSLGYAGGGDGPASAPSDERESLEFAGPDPKDHVAEMRLMDRALAMLRPGKFDQAEAALREAIERSEGQKAEMPWARANLGAVLAAQGKFAEAVSQYEAALRLRPGDGRLWSNLGLALMRLGRADDAVGALERAVRCPPVFAYTHLDLARALVRTGRSEDAMRACRAALALDERLAPAYAELGPLLAAAGRTQEALDALRRAAALDERSAGAWRKLAELLAGLGRHADARQALVRGLSASPTDPELRRSLAWLLATSADASVRDGNEALRMAEELRAAGGPTPAPAEVLDVLGAALAETGDFERAAKAAGEGMNAALKAGLDDLAAAISARREMYQTGRPYHSPR